MWLGAWGRAGGTGQGWSAGTGRDFTRLPAPACWLPLVTSSQLRAVPRVDPNTEGLLLNVLLNARRLPPSLTSTDTKRPLVRASGSMPTDGMDSIQKAPEHVTGHGSGSSGPFLRFQHCPQNLVHRRAQSQPRGQGAAEAGRRAPPPSPGSRGSRRWNLNTEGLQGTWHLVGSGEPRQVPRRGAEGEMGGDGGAPEMLGERKRPRAKRGLGARLRS